VSSPSEGSDGLSLTVGPDSSCAAESEALVTVRNSTNTTCTSDSIATLSTGDKLLFSSESGFGGEKGSWAPLPTDVDDGVGIIEYPPGARSWPITLPTLTDGTYAIALSLTCGAQKVSLGAQFIVSDVSLTTPSACESIPLPQFNLHGVTYVARNSTDTVAKADLGAVLGTQEGDIPEGLLRCEVVQLQDGQGSLAPGAHVYAIRGVDPSVAIAAEVGTEYMKLYRV
jgi:hypothetical protein